MRLKTITVLLLGSFAIAGAQQSMGASDHHHRSAVFQAQPSTLNLNSADAASLAAVKGIGPKRASAIVAYRQQHGAFKSVSDLSHVKGFGDKLIAKVKGRLTV